MAKSRFAPKTISFQLPLERTDEKQQILDGWNYDEVMDAHLVEAKLVSAFSSVGIVPPLPFGFSDG